MAINKVGTKGIKDGAISAIDFADNTITSGKLVNSAITNALLSNSSITLSGTSIALGASASFTNKFVQWQSVITGAGSSSTAVAGKGYFINTTSAVHTLNLPASASIGDFVAIKDYAGTFATYNLTIGRNGHNIQGVANDSLITTNRASLVLVYVDATKGWLYWEEHNVGDLQQALFTSATGGTIATSGDFKIHSFTGDGCFVVSQIGNSPTVPTGGPGNVDYLVVAGGGAGGGCIGGGGGAGGHRTTFPSPGCNAGAFPIAVQTYPITVGGGGTSRTPGAGPAANPGSNSTFSTITSTGGGGGGSRPGNAGQPGGSGGGAGGDGGAVGSGNTPPVSPSQGNNGGSQTAPGDSSGGGGGGGAGGVGSVGNPFGSPPAGGAGGPGTANSITASSVTRAGGGGGGSSGAAPSNSPTAPGGGGIGAGPSLNGTAGSTNTGGGGGAGSNSGVNNLGGAGGSGIVVIRYKFQ
jgi:hypothetical protein